VPLGLAGVIEGIADVEAEVEDAGVDDGDEGIGLNKSGSSSLMAGRLGAAGNVGLGAGRTAGDEGSWVDDESGFVPTPDPAADLLAVGLGAGLVVDARLLDFGLAGLSALSGVSASVVRLGLRGVAGGSIAISSTGPINSSGLIVGASHRLR
jgi:hypothetical protein